MSVVLAFPNRGQSPESKASGPAAEPPEVVAFPGVNVRHLMALYQGLRREGRIGARAPAFGTQNGADT